MSQILLTIWGAALIAACVWARGLSRERSRPLRQAVAGARAAMITLDDFDPTPRHAEEIRRAVADFDRQRTPLTIGPEGAWDYNGPRAAAGRLFGVVHDDHIVMFHQIRHAGDARSVRREVLAAFWARGYTDSDGWPIKPQKIFEINPGLFEPPSRDYAAAWDPDKMHPVLRQGLA
jgi:hypothetical protein